ncbi:MAG: M23 family metallopeptidase [Pseudomonadota bacterium]
MMTLFDHAGARKSRRADPFSMRVRGACITGMFFTVTACATAPPPPPDWNTVIGPQATVPAGSTSREAQGPFQPNAYLRLCRVQLSNAPPADADLFVRDFSPLIQVKGKVVMSTAPANDVCLSSGFGFRGGRMHKGIDLVARPAGPVYAAAPGIVREARWANGFGYYVVLDHGHSTYTRYAHLSEFADDIRPGTRLGFGQVVGTMGRTGNASGDHLHFEVLSGRWGRKGSFGFTAYDPLSFPAFWPDYLTAAAKDPENGSAAP